MATNPDDEITEAEFIAVIIVAILIFALLVLQIILILYIFCRKKRCCCFKDKETKASGDRHVETSSTCCPTIGRKSRGSVASDEYNLIREASIHSETEPLEIPVVDGLVETHPVDPAVYLKEKKRKEKKKEKKKCKREDQDDVTGRGDPAIAALKLEAFLTPGIEKEHQAWKDDGPSDTESRGKEIDNPQTGGDPGTSGLSGMEPGERSTRVDLLATQYTLPGQLEEDAIVREDQFIKGRGRSFRRPIGQYTRDMPANLPCFSLPPKGVISAWEDRSVKDRREDPLEKKASQEHSPDEDLGYSDGSRKESIDEGGNGNRELDSNEDKNREGQSQNVDKSQGHPDILFPVHGDPGTRDNAKKSKSKVKGARKSDGRHGSLDVEKTEDGKTRNGRDPQGPNVEAGPGSEEKSLPGQEGECSRDRDGKRKKRGQNGTHGKPDSTTQALGKAGPSRLIVGNDGDSGIVDLSQGDGESGTDPVARRKNNQGGYYVDDDGDDQHSMTNNAYKYWPDRVGRFRGMDQYDSADSEMVPDELDVEDAVFDNENHLMRTYTGSELKTKYPPQDNSDMRKADRQRAVNLGNGLPSVIVDTDEELSGDSKKASRNGLQQNNAKTPKKGSGSSRQKQHHDEWKHERCQHEDGRAGKKRPKEERDTSTPRVGTGSRTRQPTLQLRSHRRGDNPTGTYSDPDDPRESTAGQGHQVPPPTAETTVEKNKKIRRMRRKRDTEMSDRTVDDHHSWNAYIEHDNFCELPSPLTIIFFDSDEDLR